MMSTYQMIPGENFQQWDEIVSIAKVFEKVLHATPNLRIKTKKNAIIMMS